MRRRLCCLAGSPVVWLRDVNPFSDHPIKLSCIYVTLFYFQRDLQKFIHNTLKIRAIIFHIVGWRIIKSEKFTSGHELNKTKIWQPSLPTFSQCFNFFPTLFGCVSSEKFQSPFLDNPLEQKRKGKEIKEQKKVGKKGGKEGETEGGRERGKNKASLWLWLLFLQLYSHSLWYILLSQLVRLANSPLQHRYMEAESLMLRLSREL